MPEKDSLPVTTEKKPDLDLYNTLSQSLANAKTAEDKQKVAKQALKFKSHCDIEGMFDLAFKYSVLYCRAEWEIAHLANVSTGRHLERKYKNKLKTAYKGLSREDFEDKIKYAKENNIIPTREWFRKGFIGNSNDDEYFTPAEIVEAARKAMGGIIDLDPASCAFAQKTVKAKKYYTKEQDGLSQPWYGNVWLNPPFSNLYGFSKKLCLMSFTNKINQAVFLGRMDVGTRWGQNMLFAANVVCMPKSRIQFYKADGETASNNMANIIFGVKVDSHKFFEAFKNIGQTIDKTTSEYLSLLQMPADIQDPKFWGIYSKSMITLPE